MSLEDVASGERQNRGDSVNQATLIGRLVATPELRETGSGKHVTTVRVETDYFWILGPQFWNLRTT